MAYLPETIAILRNCHLQVGAQFVRCRVRDAGQKSADLVRAEIASAVDDIGEDGCHLAWHPDFGEYLRVNRGTNAFALICHMKS